jgi:RimJ/RimL family protein N-acetyltransferase
MKILEKRVISDRNVVFRYPKSSDLIEMMKTINSLVEEHVDIAKATKVNYKQEKIWLTDVLKSIRKNESIMIVAQVDGDVVGSCQVTRDIFDVSRHVGTLGVALQKEVRGIGIGTRLVKLCLTESKKIGIKIVKIYVFDTNKEAMKFYKKFGFKEIGRIRRGVLHNNRYKDDIIMTKQLF